MRSPAFGGRHWATIALLVANGVAFLAECIFYGYPPKFHHQDLLALSWSGLQHGYIWQLLSFQFLHVGLLHLLLNCWVIFVFGRELEQALGARRFLALYFTAGIIGGLCQAAVGALAQHYGHSVWALRFAAPTVGASAGALGLLAGFATLFPERTLTLLLFLVVPFTMRAKFLLAFFGLLTLFGIAFPVENMADIAHLGGLLTGIFFIRLATGWEWHLPKLSSRGPRRPRLVKVVSGGGGAWAKAKPVTEEELPPEEFLSREVDPILDKISAQGIQSLTQHERRILEAARQKIGRP